MCYVIPRDPVSVTFDDAAAQLLNRARHARGDWVTTRIADPTPAQVRRWASHGIDVEGPDNPSVPGGRGLNARTRWARALVRALYYQHKNQSMSGALRVEIGRRMPARGVIPAGRQIRIQLASGGIAAARAVDRLASVSRIYNDDGSPAWRQSQTELRDWI